MDWISAKRKHRGPVRPARHGAGHAPEAAGSAVAGALRRTARRRQKDPRAELDKRVLERTAELRQTLATARQTDLAKDAFLANVSHELRTPLGAVTGLAALALEHAEDARQRDYLEKIGNAGRHMSRIINDLLDLSKIVAGRMEFETVPFRLRAMLEHARNVLKHKAEAKGLRLAFRVGNLVPEVLVGDSLRLEQILLNLVGNAIKFTASGAVELRVTHVPGAKGRVWLVIEVEDSGVGMRAEDVAGLFRPYAQGDVSTSRKYGGTGLGLALSQQLAQAMDGGISVKTEVGKGSMFSLRVRLGVGSAASLARTDVAAAMPALRPQFAGANILLVEDDAINIEIVGELLGGTGIALRLARNGQEALDILAAGPDAFDLVLMDIQMPIMDGLTATRRIRAWPGFERLPIVAMTAHALEHERQNGATAGLNDHFVKPFEVKVFYAMLSKWLPATKQIRPADRADISSAPGL